MAQVDKSVDLLKIIREGLKGGGSTASGKPAAFGLYVVKVITADPEVTILFEGSELPLGEDIFEIPLRFQPLEEGARYFALPITGSGQRWGLIEKLDGKEITGSFTTADNKTVTITNGTISEIT